MKDNIIDEFLQDLHQNISQSCLINTDVFFHKSFNMKIKVFYVACDVQVDRVTKLALNLGHMEVSWIHGMVSADRSSPCLMAPLSGFRNHQREASSSTSSYPALYLVMGDIFLHPNWGFPHKQLICSRKWSASAHTCISSMVHTTSHVTVS